MSAPNVRNASTFRATSWETPIGRINNQGMAASLSLGAATGTFSAVLPNGIVTTSLIPSLNNTFDLGATGSQFRSLYVSTGTING